MDTPSNVKEFEVSGVSRSGRIRKKSSKLIDFGDERPKRTTNRVRGASSKIGRPRKISEADLDTAEDEELKQSDEDVPNLVRAFSSSQESGLDVGAGAAGKATDSEDEMDELVGALVEGVEAESLENDSITKMRQSTYMTEMSNKRKMLKNGKVVTGKLERKDKGKTRFTAYSMWAKEFRKTSKFSKNQHLDFSNAAKRLGEMWANVSNKEKSAWRRKAKMQATRAKTRDRKAQTIGSNPYSNSASNQLSSSNASAFINRATTNRTKKLAVERQNSPAPATNNSTPRQDNGKRAANNNGKRRSNSQSQAGFNNLSVQKSPAGATTTMYSSVVARSGKNSILPLPSIETIDIAAHLKLLGESLSVIGDHLKSHDGQITSSGSLSVLLDSMLCSIAPLMCLTTQIPGMAVRQPQLKTQLASTMDNIAYILPGL